MMRYLKLTIFLLFIIAMIFTSCDKNKIDIIKDEGIILYEGNPAVDGCGYFLLIKSNEYKPIDLNPEFFVDSLVVSVEYQLQETKWTCNWQKKEYTQIKIINISNIKK